MPISPASSTVPIRPSEARTRPNNGMSISLIAVEFEIAVGDGQDGADYGDAREAVDQEREDRAAGNHRGGRNIGREILRDPSERIGEEHDHEDHFQAGQNAVEDPQELRHRCG